MQKRTLSIGPDPSIPLRSHQGEREKNEYSYDGKNTRELPQSKQIKVVKKVLQEGTYFVRGRITNQELQSSSNEGVQHNSLENVMDAKWNNIVDNTMVRIAMVVVGFGAWLAIGYGLLAA
jgi:hypothetical protein